MRAMASLSCLEGLRDGVVVALGHLAPVQARQGGDVFLDHRFGQDEELAAVAEQVVETLADVAGHLHVLHLVAADRDLVRVEHQDVRGHQHRIAVEAHGHAGVRVFAGLDIAVHRGLVGMRAVEQTLGTDAGEQPGQLGNLGDVRLPVEGRTLDVQAAGQPGRGDFQARALDTSGIVARSRRGSPPGSRTNPRRSDGWRGSPGGWRRRSCPGAECR